MICGCLISCWSSALFLACLCFLVVSAIFVSLTNVPSILFSDYFVIFVWAVVPCLFLSSSPPLLNLSLFFFLGCFCCFWSVLPHPPPSLFAVYYFGEWLSWLFLLLLFYLAPPSLLFSNLFLLALGHIVVLDLPGWDAVALYLPCGGS